MSGALQANLLGLGGATIADRYVLTGPIACTRDLAIFRGSERGSERELFFEIAVAPAASGEPPRSEVLSKIGHPSIAVALESGRIEPGFAYAVMQPIAGKSLLSLLTGASKGRLEPARALPIGIAIAELLELVHAAGGVYGQLHPARVFVDGEAEHPRIALSPGVPVPSPIDLRADEAVRALCEARPELAWDQVPTELGAPVTYAAPELFAGEAASARSEVYSLGALLYELLCGKRPYSSTIATRLAAAHLMRTPIEIDPALPEPLVELLAQALRHDPSERHASMRELAAALATLLEPPPAPESRPSAPSESDGEALSTRDTLVLTAEELRAMQSLSRPSSRPDPIPASPRDPTKQHYLSELVPEQEAPVQVEPAKAEPLPTSRDEQRKPGRAIAAALIATALALLIVWRVATPSDAPAAHVPEVASPAPRDTAIATTAAPVPEPQPEHIEVSVDSDAVPAATAPEIPRRRPARSAKRPKAPKAPRAAKAPYKIDDLKRPEH